MIDLSILLSDYEEILDALDIVISDRCCSSKERQEIRDVMARIKAAYERKEAISVPIHLTGKAICNWVIDYICELDIKRVPKENRGPIWLSVHQYKTVDDYVNQNQSAKLGIEHMAVDMLYGVPICVKPPWDRCPKCGETQ